MGTPPGGRRMRTGLDCQVESMACGMDLLQAEGCVRARPEDGLPGGLQGLCTNLLQGQGRVADRYQVRQTAVAVQGSRWPVAVGWTCCRTNCQWCGLMQ